MMGEEIEDSPGSQFQIFLDMEEILNTLKILEYDREYCRQLHHKPISRHYFALPTNPGEQFHAFSCLASWLVRQTGRQMEEPQEYDDPNAIISSILDHVRTFGHAVDFPPNKLKTGCGVHCVFVLQKLSEEALAHKHFTFKMPEYPEEAADEENIIEDDGELDINQMEPEKQDVLDEVDDEDFMEDEDNVLDLDGLKKLSTTGQASDDIVKPDEIMESTIDSSEWMLEVERVMPQLKVTLRADGKDWRSHLDAMHHHQRSITECYTQVRQHLKRLEEDIGRGLDKINSREKFLNSQMEGSLNELRAAQDRLAEIRERYRQASGGISERSRQLQDISEELDRIKTEMEERGNSMTDGSPLVRIKQALQRLKNELKEMDIRSGVLEHILLQTKLREKAMRGNKADDDGGYLF